MKVGRTQAQGGHAQLSPQTITLEGRVELNEDQVDAASMLRPGTRFIQENCLFKNRFFLWAFAVKLSNPK